MHIRETILPWAQGGDRRLLASIDFFTEKVARYGIKVSLETDFHQFKALHRMTGKRPLTPNFDPDTSFLLDSDGFWMMGWDRSGQIVMTQAARLYDCQAMSVADLHQSLHAFYTMPARHAEQGETCRSQALAAHSIRGHVCYHGELWLAPAYRGLCLTDPLAKLLMVIVLFRWAPDYLFGMAQPGICTKGVAARYGYRNMQPGGMIWTVPSQGTLDEWIIWNNREQLHRVVRQP